MSKKILALIAVSALFLGACSSGGTTDPSIGVTDDTTLGVAADVAAEVETLQSDLAGFATEIESNTSESVQTAFTDVQTEVSNLVAAASDLAITPEELSPVTDAVSQFGDLVASETSSLSPEFMDFWNELPSRLSALTA